MTTITIYILEAIPHRGSIFIKILARNIRFKLGSIINQVIHDGSASAQMFFLSSVDRKINNILIYKL